MPRRHARLRVVATGPKGSVPVRVRRPPRLDLMTSTVRRGFGPGFTPNGPLGGSFAAWRIRSPHEVGAPSPLLTRRRACRGGHGSRARGAALVVLADQVGRHGEGGGEGVGFALDLGGAVVLGVAFLLVDLGVAAEERLLAGRAVHDPVAELVADREAAAAGPLARLLRVHPDLARAGEQEPGERLPSRSSGAPGAEVMSSTSRISSPK